MSEKRGVELCTSLKRVERKFSNWLTTYKKLCILEKTIDKVKKPRRKKSSFVAFFQRAAGWCEAAGRAMGMDLQGPEERGFCCRQFCIADSVLHRSF